MGDTSTSVEVEACLPFASTRAQPRELPADIEVLPAETLQPASTVLPGPEGAYPQVLNGCDAVASWITRHGFEVAGPAYEIYRHWNGEAGHPDNMLEVGFPVTS